MSNCKHPKVKVKLVGLNGNAYVLLAAVRQGLRKAKVPTEEIQEFLKEATSGDYDHLLLTCMNWVDVR